MQKRALKTKQKILATALKMFAKKGFHGTKIDEIADKANANKQRIYAYFGNKKGLFTHCLIYVLNEINKFENKTLKFEKNNLEALTERLLSEYLRFHDRHPEFWRMLIWANLEGITNMEKFINIRSDNFKHIRKLFEYVKMNGGIKKDVSFTAYIFTIMAIAFFYNSNRKTLSITLSKKIFTHKNDFINEVKKMLNG